MSKTQPFRSLRKAIAAGAIQVTLTPHTPSSLAPVPHSAIAFLPTETAGGVC